MIMRITRFKQKTRAAAVAATVLVSAVGAAVHAQSDRLDAELRRIFQTHEYAEKTFGPAVWLDGGSSYIVVETTDKTSALVSYETATGRRDVLVDASMLTPTGAAAPLSIDGYEFSHDRKSVLVFTNTKKVWRENTRGDYWLLNRETRALRKIGQDAPESSLMFAKFSPDGLSVAYVRDRDLYVEKAVSGEAMRVTTDGAETIVNGTSDWVNEEELGIRDGFRWSPDGRSIAYWQFDTSGVERFTLVNDTDATYPAVLRFPYPKAGTVNSSVRIGIVDAGGGQTRWMNIPGDSRNTYLAKLQWTSDGRRLLIQQLNRLQNSNDLLAADARTGDVRRVFRDTNQAWVDVNDDVREVGTGTAATWLSEKDGWRHLYRLSLDGSAERLLTKFDGDVIDVVSIDEKNGWAYFLASPHSAIERFLYRAKLDGDGAVERVTPADQRGTHGYQISPDGRWAFHSASRADVPARVELVSMPDHRSVRMLDANADAVARVATLVSSPTEFFTVDIGGGVVLDASIIKPRSFDPARKYPVIVYVYGEPAGQTVTDRWGGSRGLFHHALADEGYVIASFDNRGTPAPKGAAWRKVIYGTVGELSAKEQTAAINALAARYAYIDRDRIGVWGWSGGGSNTLNMMFRSPDVYKVGVSVAPVPDQRLYDTIYQERYMGLPQENADGYRVGSPVNFAEGLKGKLLVIHGSGDDNVHYQGTERLVNRLVELGKPFDLMVYPNRTHAISEGPGTSLHVHSLIARYFLEHLPPGPKDASAADR
jgi:dipeptidyl-peptidase 4